MSKLPTAKALYFGANRDLFGWLHLPYTNTRRTPVVICNAMGYEYVRSHRTVRELAERLAADGYVTLRFDYHGCGDSAGSDSDDDRIDAWLNSIRDGIDCIKTQTGRDDVTLVGLRLGATLAGAISEKLPIARLVFWHPCITGREYVREMQIIAATDVQPPNIVNSKHTDNNATPGEVDAAGFLLTPDTIAGISRLQIGKNRLQGSPKILVIERNDGAPSNRIEKALDSSGCRVTRKATGGYKKMMLAPQYSTVPHEAINTICEWLSIDQDTTEIEKSEAPQLPSRTQFQSVLQGQSFAIFEQAIHFGKDGRLFGIISGPAAPVPSRKPAVIMLCGGSVHRVSANRMYVPIARQLATAGMTVLRMDLSGIGDSRSETDGPENKPYTTALREDVEAAMSAIAETNEYILLGLCSGAYAAMQAAKFSDQIRALILINQLVYYLDANDLASSGSDENQLIQDFDYPRSQRLADRLLRKVLILGGSRISWLGRIFSQRLIGGNLTSDLAELSKRSINLTFIHSQDDPACEALQLPAGEMVGQLVREDKATLKVFSRTDHTFSQSESQKKLTDWLVQHVRHKFS